MSGASFDFSQIKGVIWDLDNTLYRFSGEFRQSCNVAAAKAALEAGLDLPFEAALHLAERSESEHGMSMHAYITDHGLSVADLHIPFHRHIDESIIRPFTALPVLLEDLSLPQVILTNASRCWAERALQHIGLRHLFPDAHIIPIEDVGFEPKAATEKGFQKALEILGFSASNVVMVDDLDRNLEMAYQVGLRTVYMHYDDPFETLPDFINAQFENSEALLITQSK
ncbi:MAG: HAD family hydrolase [Alphaproteobacteria bacterium]|nr:HAD family hydrolase [Alphaproteobacteria bacterium]